MKQLSVINKLVNVMPEGLKNAAARKVYQAKENAPEIFFVGGTITLGLTIYCTYKAAEKNRIILMQRKAEMETAKAVKEEREANENQETDGAESYDAQNGREKFIDGCKFAGKLVKANAPVVALSGVSLACFYEAYKIPTERFKGAVIAFNGLSALFTEYRRRVIEEEGIDKDRHYMYGSEWSEETKKVKGEDGKTKKVTEYTEEIDPTDLDRYSIVFDERNDNWTDNFGYNKMFISGRQAMANTALEARGSISFAEILDGLGFDREFIGKFPEAYMIGYLCPDAFGSYNKVNFGLDYLDDENVRRFINGDSKSVLLRFEGMQLLYTGGRKKKEKSKAKDKE